MSKYDLKYVNFYKLAVLKKIRKNSKKRIVDSLLAKKYKPTSINFKAMFKVKANPEFIEAARSDAPEVFGIKIDINNIDWHKDLKNGLSFPAHRFDLYKLDEWFNIGCDVKFPWELSRAYFLVKLGLDYSVSNNPGAYKLYKSIISDWIDKNPFLYGVNWLSPMEAGIRAINWIVSSVYFESEINADDEFRNKLSVSLQQHGDFIYNFPEIYGRGTTNHTTFNFGALLFIAMVLPGDRESGKRYAAAISGLEYCIKEQTYNDGVNFEASIPYHRLVLEMFGYAAVLMGTNGKHFSLEYYRLLFKMFEYSAAYIDKEGNFPLIGDNDSGKLLMFNSKELDDQKYLLELGQSIFDHDFGPAGPGFPQIYSFYKKANPYSLGITPRKSGISQEFTDSGVFILRNNDILITINSQQTGQNGANGHNHNDWGSYTLTYQGIPFVVDPGLFTYTRDFKLRNIFRSASSHNVAQIEDEEYFEYSESAASMWNMIKKNRLEILSRSLSGEEDKLQISYSYARFPEVGHKREFIFDKIHNKFTVRDIIRTPGQRKLRYRTGFHPEALIALKDTYALIECRGAKIEMQTNIGLILSQDLYSPQYGVLMDHPVLEHKGSVCNEIIIETAFQGLQN